MLTIQLGILLELWVWVPMWILGTDPLWAAVTAQTSAAQEPSSPAVLSTAALPAAARLQAMQAQVDAREQQLQAR